MNGADRIRGKRPGIDRGLSGGLRLVAEVEMDDSCGELLSRMAPWMASRRRRKSKGKVSLTGTRDSVRMDILETGPLGEPHSIITSLDSGDMIYLDRSLGGYLKIPAKSRIAPHPREPINVTISSVSQKREILGYPVTRYRVTLGAPGVTGEFVQDFELSDDPTLSPYVRGVFAAMFGDGILGAEGDDPMEDLVSGGMPLEVITYAPGGREALTRVRVVELEVMSYRPDSFRLPPEMEDLSSRWARERELPGHERVMARRSSVLHRDKHLKNEERLSALIGKTSGSGQTKTQPIFHGPDPIDLGVSLREPVLGRISNRPGHPRVGANLCDEILRDVETLVEVAAERLQGFEGRDGTLVLDWLMQLAQHAEAHPERSGIYCLMHDEEEGQGLLDRI
ncbi:MAG: hypothetical protein ACLFS8_04895, partial [Clostridia bacterium]